MNNLEAMEQRKSVRSYINEEVEQSVIRHLEDSLSESHSSMAKGNVRFEVITGYSKEAKTGFLYGLGRINAPAMIVGIYEEEEDLECIVKEYKKREHGFGYDPIFFSDEAGEIFGNISKEEKFKYSHRGKAIRDLVSFLRELYS